MPSSPTPARVQVSVDDRHLARIDEVAARLRAAGMDVRQVMPEAGVITGSIDEERLGALAGVEGVGAVERSQVTQLRPPDSPVQ